MAGYSDGHSDIKAMSHDALLSKATIRESRLVHFRGQLLVPVIEHSKVNCPAPLAADTLGGSRSVAQIRVVVQAKLADGSFFY